MKLISLTEITEHLIRLHKKYSNERRSNEESQICTFWSTDNPPDIIENTAPLIAIEKALDFRFEEDELYEFYDMEVDEAAEYIVRLMKERG